MFFLELSCFFNDPADVGYLISGSSAFSKTSFNIWKFMVHALLKPDLENFEHYFSSMWDECNCAIVWAFFGIAFTELLIHPWTSASFLESFACAWISESLCVVNYFLCISLSLLNIFSRRDMICYFLHLMLTSYSEFSSIAYPCGDLWHKFIISVVVFEVWVIAH